MRISKKIPIVTGLIVMVMIGVAAIEPTAGNNDFKNLQVLPKGISTKDLQRIMVDDFQDGLGVSCTYCHAQQKGSLHLDYASDEKPEKEIARFMMRMSMDINRKYFNVAHPVIGDSALVISCFNCHQGNARPH